MKTVRDFIFLGSKITVDSDCGHKIKRCLLLGGKLMLNIDTELKSRDISLPAKVCMVKAMIFPVVMHGWGLDHKERWALKNWCFQTVVLEKTLESLLGCKEIKPVYPKGNQPCEEETLKLQFSSVQSVSHVRLSMTPWIAAQASLSITNS